MFEKFKKKSKSNLKEKDTKKKNNSSSQEYPELPDYKSVKALKALEIKMIERSPRKNDTTAIFTPKNKEFKPFTVDRHYVKANKFSMEEGGYYVVNEDGSKGFIDAKTFKKEFKKA